MQTQMRLSVPLTASRRLLPPEAMGSPEERLYPVVNDLLDDWLSSFRPPFTGIRVFGSRWSHNRIKSKTSWPEIRCPISGWTLRQMKSTPLVSMLNLMPHSYRWCSFPTVHASYSRRTDKLLRKWTKDACRKAILRSSHCGWWPSWSAAGLWGV